MKKFIVIEIFIAGLVSDLSAGVIPSDLQWPLKNKGVADTSIFFDTEDAVDVPKGDARNCGVDGKRGGSETHFDRHAGHDIIANYNTPVYPIYEGYIVAIGSGIIYKGASWKNYIVVEHDNNGQKWTSVYWHLQNKGLVNTKKADCNLRETGNTNSECKVTKDTVLGYTDDTTDMNDVNHLHLGIRPKPYLKGISQLGFAIGKDLNYFEDPLDYLPKKWHLLLDDENFRNHKPSWNKSNKLDMYSGIGYRETSKIGSESFFYPMYSKINTDTRLKIYAKFPVSNDSSKVAIYALNVNGSWVNVERINQSDFSHRGHNVLLFDHNFKKGDIILIIGFNYDKNGNPMSSDAILFVEQ